MNKRALYTATAALLKKRGLRKRMATEKQDTVITIKDTYDNERTIRLPGVYTEHNYIYTYEDVERIADTLFQIAADALCYGEGITIKGVCKIGLKARRPRSVTGVMDGEQYNIDGCYVPYANLGSMFKNAAKEYQEKHPVTFSDGAKQEEDVDFSEFFYQLTGEMINTEEDTE